MFTGKKFTRDQLVLVMKDTMHAALDRIQSSIPDTIPLSEYKERENEIGQYIHGCIGSVASFPSILYASLTNDGLGIGDFPEFGEFEKMAWDFVKSCTEPDLKDTPSHPDCTTLAGKLVDRLFKDYLSPE